MSEQVTIMDALKLEEKVDYTDCVFSLYDKKSSTYSAPFLAMTSLEAQRILSDMVYYGGDNMVSRYRDDYDLYQLGTYDKRSGVLNPFLNKSFVINAGQLPHTRLVSPVIPEDSEQSLDD